MAVVRGRFDHSIARFQPHRLGLIYGRSHERDPACERRPRGEGAAADTRDMGYQACKA